MHTHFLHKVVNITSINQSSAQESKHLAFISRVAAPLQSTQRCGFCFVHVATPNQAVPAHCSASPFSWTQIRLAPWQPGLPWNPAWDQSKEPGGWHLLCPRPHHRCVSAAGSYNDVLVVTRGLSGNASPLTSFN